jgi:hypothetical protein
MALRKDKSVNTEVVDDTSIPYRVVIDFLEGTLRKQDAIAFARGFIEHHFDAQNNSGYYVAPYVGGYIFEVQEGGSGRAYLPGILQVLDENPAASACIQMARRVLEVKKSSTGAYTAILLPEGTEPQNPDKVFPEPSAKLIPFQRSGMAALIVGGAIFGIGFLALFLTTVVYLVEVSGLMAPPMAKVDYAALPLTQWQSLMNVGGEKSNSYVKAIKYANGKWTSITGQRQEEIPGVDAPAVPTQAQTQAATGTLGAPPSLNPLTPPTAAGSAMHDPAAPASLPAPPSAVPAGTTH